MTIEQYIMDVEANTASRVREEMEQYVASANKRADKAEQNAVIAEQRADKAEQDAAIAEQRADKAEQENIANIIEISKSFNCSDEQIINQLMTRASLTYEEASKILAEYKPA